MSGVTAAVGWIEGSATHSKLQRSTDVSCVSLVQLERGGH